MDRRVDDLVRATAREPVRKVRQMSAYSSRGACLSRGSRGCREKLPPPSRPGDECRATNNRVSSSSPAVFPLRVHLARRSRSLPDPGRRRKIALRGDRTCLAPSECPNWILIFTRALLVFDPRSCPSSASRSAAVSRVQRASDDEEDDRDEIEQGKREAETVRKQVSEAGNSLTAAASLETPRAPEATVPRAESPIRPT